MRRDETVERRQREEKRRQKRREEKRSEEREERGGEVAGDRPIVQDRPRESVADYNTEMEEERKSK